ncbi:U-box domain-containing protein 70 (OsPUB70) (Plant U-box protein 70) (Receptor-like cytoplasmic kinase 197) (OsRLCK197) [Includes: E3 ubiquitin ligase (RING-type E3 ubiquitin transferase) [Durusdinium trenchii]
MEDPVVAADGVSYERYAIELWWRNGHHSSPLTNLPLEHAMLLPNQALRNLIQEHLSSWSLEQLDELQRRRQREQRRLHDANGSDAVSAVPRFASNFCISTQVMQDSHPAFLLLALSRRLL